MQDLALSRHSRWRNATPVMWAMIGIPLATILASAVTIFLAVDGAEPPLPPQYVSEGKALEADLALGEAARRAGIQADLTISADGRIEALLAQSKSPLPESLRLRLTHATLPALDRDVVLRSVAPGRYAAITAPVGVGSWLVQLDAHTAVDAQARWRLRGRILAPAERVAIGY